MKRFRPALRRVLAVAAGAAIGLIGAVAIASPASAHHSEVKGTYYCDTKTGEWVVEWTVDTYDSPQAHSFKLIYVNLEPAGSTVTNIAVTEGRGNYPHTAGVPLVGEQRLSSDATSASLTVKARWNNGKQDRSPRSATVRFEGTCEQEREPGPIGVTDTPSCTELAVTVTNPEDGETTTFVVTPSEGDAIEATLEPGQTESYTFPAAEGLTYQVTVDGAEIGSGAWEEPDNCTAPVASAADCDSLTVEVTNPLEEGSIEATISSGDESKTLTIAPGESGEVTFDAEEGTVATVTIGEESLDIAWEEPEEGCDGEGGGLPVTGSSTGLVAGAAIALLLLGAGMFLVARRRRITFTS